VETELIHLLVFQVLAVLEYYLLLLAHALTTLAEAVVADITEPLVVWVVEAVEEAVILAK